ncbi:oligopeptide/dipeptide ABC transporter ATP-binding protein [Roseiconus lacunae]|uniref:ABC transporter ATP-binding protein n=1 Tax=Roseiconus lacunae TaxID=2605694 RepID=UPI001E385E9E|nr:oligopeptide/dipeptide ABC transporter ATP-binding protein [Roseiconus lacunae]MCD0460520.1 ATP-binding cassette domain-containing protein [Roseiconus lacunae]WRQ52888.1 oligopeptide/dipeptide ABC transporter ATP-binding protein [Stieleria sp. HD01]
MSDSSSPTRTSTLLSVDDLKVYFPFSRGSFLSPEHGFIRAVDGVSFEIGEGETLALVGESGCGKSTTARAITGLAPITAGSVRVDGTDITGKSAAEMLRYRREVQMVFQDPFASLNPRMTVGSIIGEPLAVHGLASGKDRKLEVLRLMDLVGLNPRFLNRYPHEFSGGQRQRIGIARALAVNPKLILCDEPVSALDVSIQAQIINLLMDLQQQLGLSYLFIAHDLSVVRHISTRVGVMYLGRIVELGTAESVYNHPTHPYTEALLSAVPVPDPNAAISRNRIRLEGEVPTPDKEYVGCSFINRCPIAVDRCRSERPPQTQSPQASAPHTAACWERT